MIWLRLAWREIVNSRRFAAFFMLNIALGLVGFIMVAALKSSIDQSLRGKSREILGADLSVSAFRPLTNEETTLIDNMMPPGTEVAGEFGWISMVSVPQTQPGTPAPPARLMEIRAVDPRFPFYGQVEFTGIDGKTGNGTIFKQMDTQPIAIAGPELFYQLDRKPGDEIRIGDQIFTLAGTITSDPSTSSASFSIAPRLYMGRAWADRTGLIQRGSRLTHARLYRITARDFDIAPLEAQIKEALKTKTEIRIRSHESATDELARILKFLGDYLGVVSIIAILLAGIGGNYLIFAHVRGKIKELAILQAIGAMPSATRWITLWQMVILGSAGAGLAVVLSSAMLPALRDLLAPFLGASIHITTQPASVFTAILLGALGAPVAALPVFAHIKGMNAAQLFQEHEHATPMPPRQWILPALPSIIVIFGLAAWQTKSLLAGLLFLFVTGASALILGVAGVTFLKAIAWLAAFTTGSNQSSASTPLALMMALRSMSRARQTTLISFVTMGLCAALVSAVPQVRAILTSELKTTKTGTMPGLFLFDVQPEQEPEIRAWLDAKGARVDQMSPLIRARLEEINGVKLGDTFDNIPGTRERETEERFKNRTYNLSVRGNLSASEQLVDGRPFETVRHDPGRQSLPEISIEKRFSERTGIKIGDELLFNIQGVMIKGRVVNLRRVRWASFQPNFFVQFQEGVIDDAPRTFIGTIPELGFEATQSLQREMAQKFPNVSVVDVKSAVERILGISDQITLAVTVMAIMCLVAGLGVLVSITIQQARRRAFETALLKVLGASFSSVYQRTLAESVLTALFASACGFVVSFGVAWVLSRFVFDGIWVFAWRDAAAPAAVILVLTVVVTMAFSRLTLGTKPRALLQDTNH